MGNASRKNREDDPRPPRPSTGFPCSGIEPLALASHGPERWLHMDRNRGLTWSGTVAALRLLATIQRHQVKLGRQSLRGINAPTAQQLELFAALDTKSPPKH